MFENRRYLIIPTSITGSINFNEVMETSPNTLRLSNDKSKTFVKYDVIIYEQDQTVNILNHTTNEQETVTILAGTYNRPSFYSTEYPEYTYEEIIQILSTPEWVQEKPTIE